MSYKAPLASASEFGSVKAGTGITITNGVISSNQAYGYFSDSTTQTNPVISLANTATFNTTEVANAVSMVAGSQITFATAGTYALSLTMQINKTDGGSDGISVWLSKNGVNIPNSNIEVTLVDSGGNGGYRAGTFLVTVAAGDFIQVKWSSADIAMRFLATGTQLLPTRPATPSIRVTVTQEN